MKRARNTNKILTVFLVMAMFTLPFGAGVLAADNYPVKPVKLIVPWGAGGGTDKVARSFIPFLERHLGVPVIVKNMRGGGRR